MSEPVPPPPALERQVAKPVRSPNWWRQYYDTAMMFWAHASGAYPEFFQEGLLIQAVRVTPNELANIRYNRSGGQYDPTDYQTDSFYLIGDYVGKVVKHVVNEAEDHTPGDILYTPTSYHSYGVAMYEASLIAQEAIKCMMRHLLGICYYSYAEKTPKMTLDLMIELVLFTGVVPDLDSDHERESKSRREE